MRWVLSILAVAGCYQPVPLATNDASGDAERGVDGQTIDGSAGSGSAGSAFRCLAFTGVGATAPTGTNTMSVPATAGFGLGETFNGIARVAPLNAQGQALKINALAGFTNPAVYADGSNWDVLLLGSDGVSVSTSSDGILWATPMRLAPALAAFYIGTPSFDAQHNLHVMIEKSQNAGFSEYVINGSGQVQIGTTYPTSADEPSLSEGATVLVYRNNDVEVDVVSRTDVSESFSLSQPTPLVANVNTPVLSEDCKTLWGVDAADDLVVYTN